MSLPTTTSTSIITYYFSVTSCAIVRTLLIPEPTTATSIDDFADQAIITYHIREFREPICRNWYHCTDQVQSNPDVAGIGIIVAFLVTAWAALIFLVVSYCTGRMPTNYVRRIDTICFRANSARCDDE